MIDVMHQSDEIYRRDASLGKRLRIGIAGTNVLTDATDLNIAGQNANGTYEYA